MKVDNVSRFIRSFTHNIQNPSSQISKELLVLQLGELIPEFKHAETNRNLDDRIQLRNLVFEIQMLLTI